MNYDIDYAGYPEWFWIREVYNQLASGNEVALGAALQMAITASFKHNVDMQPRRREINLDSPLLTRQGDHAIMSLMGQYGNRLEVISKLLWAEELYNEALANAAQAN